MSTLPSESLLPPLSNATESSFELADATDRRSDVDSKQLRVAALLQSVGCEGLLVLDRDNFAWLTSGGAARTTLDRDELPALYYSQDQRWLLASNADSQRLFDEEIDGLGFQLKEWPWYWGREQLLADLCHGKKLACDVAYGDCKVVGRELRLLRRKVNAYEEACYLALGKVLSHALEATCRTMQPDLTEREVAGQVSHRLVHRGVQPVILGVAADGRSRLYRQFGFTSMKISRHAVLFATARKYGLNVSASRTVCFGEPDPQFRRDHDAACKVCAAYLAATWPDGLPGEILAAGRRVYQIVGYEHDWRESPQGFLTGRAAVEEPLTPDTEELFQAGWSVTWRAGVASGLSCDTFLVTDKGPRLLTPTEAWPLKRIRIQGAEFVRPDVLQR